MGHEREHPDDGREREPDGDPLRHDAGARLEPHVLEEQDDLEPLAVDDREPEEREPPRRPRALAPGLGEEPLAALVVHRDPPGPVDLVKEPVHDHQQHDDGQQARRRLDVEGRRVHGVDEGDDDEPRRHARHERAGGPPRDRPAVDPVRAHHARRHRREHEDRLQPLPEDDEPRVHDDGPGAQVGRERVGVAGRGDPLPHQRAEHAEHAERPEHQPSRDNPSHGQSV